MKKILILTTFVLVLFSGCRSEKLILTEPDLNEIPVTLQVRTGEYWNETFDAGLVKVKITPQIAIWAEDTEGRFLSTLYVTEKFAKQEWRSRNTYDPDMVFRLDALPIWYARSHSDVTKNNPLPDTLTSASPKQDFTLLSGLPASPRTIVLYLEINNSYDYYSTENREGYNGQPSVLYRAEIDTSDTEPVRMELAGHAGGDAENGAIYDDFQEISTARDILDEIIVSTEE